MLGTMKLLLLFAVFVIVTAYEPTADVEAENKAVDDSDEEDLDLRSFDTALDDDDINDEEAAELLATLASENPENAQRYEKRGWGRRRRWRRIRRWVRRAARKVQRVYRNIRRAVRTVKDVAGVAVVAGKK